MLGKRVRRRALVVPGLGRSAGRALVVHIDRVADWRCVERRVEVKALVRRDAVRNIGCVICCLLVLFNPRCQCRLTLESAISQMTVL